ncbi:MAG: hydroxysqualene dehydroxylase HpnE [Ignavibacteriales bacterium]|nr:hydroxysqualene dehydroxylase HpnE [Ignavibacteriales bacterium]
MTPDVLIIGGGLSGLSAALHLVDSGYSVHILEQSPQCGGRARSFRDPVTGDDVDNGQHILMGCYHETLRFIERIGTRRLISVQQPLRSVFREKNHLPHVLSALPLPAPLHALSALLRFHALNWSERMAAVRAAWALVLTDESQASHLQLLTVRQLLDSLGQPERCRTAFWDVLCVGMLNERSSVASASMFVRTLQRLLSGKRSDASIVLPCAGLSSVLVDPAIEALRKRGAQIETSSTVELFEESGGIIQKVVVTGGRELTPRAIISAVPFFALSVVGDGYLIDRLPSVRKAERLRPAPIVSVHLWFDRPVMREKFSAILNSPIQWAFNTGVIQRKKEEGSHLSLVISGAREEVEIEKEEIKAMAVRELGLIYPFARTARLIHSLVVKERRATFSPAPGTEELRPPSPTAIGNLFLAGDWTATQLPATIEGAILSGATSAAAVRNYLQHSA